MKITELYEIILVQCPGESSTQLSGPAEEKVLLEALSKITWANQLGQNNIRGAKIFPLSKPEQLLPRWGGRTAHQWDFSVTSGKLGMPQLQYHFREVIKFSFPYSVLHLYKC